MQKTILTLIAGALLCGSALAQQPAQANDPQDKDQAPPQGAPGVVTLHVAAGPGGGMAFRMGNGPLGMGGDELNAVIHTLGELNLAPAFNLSAEQKQKIQAIRDEFKSLTDAWHKEHADELKQLDDQQKEMFQNMQNGPPDPGAMQEMMQQREQLMETAPNGEDQAAAVKALLTDEQKKQFEAKQAEEEKERQEAMRNMPMRFGPMRGPHDHEPADKDKDADKDTDKDKDKDGKDKGR